MGSDASTGGFTSGVFDSGHGCSCALQVRKRTALSVLWRLAGIFDNCVVITAGIVSGPRVLRRLTRTLAVRQHIGYRVLVSGGEPGRTSLEPAPQWQVLHTTRSVWRDNDGSSSATGTELAESFGRSSYERREIGCPYLIQRIRFGNPLG